MTRVYVAGRWKNENQRALVHALRRHGHHVYDFRCVFVPLPGLVLPEKWLKPTAMQLVAEQRRADCDAAAIEWAQVCVVAAPDGEKRPPPEPRIFRTARKPVVFHAWPPDVLVRNGWRAALNADSLDALLERLRTL